MPSFTLVFDEVILKQLRKLGEDTHLRGLISKMFNKMELLGPDAGKLIDSHLFLHEIKLKHPPLRLYYRQVKSTNEIQVFEYEMKTDEKKQRQTIHRLRTNLRNQDPYG